jgi:4-hydroxy-tetrahydrodipicolinate synthase
VGVSESELFISTGVGHDRWMTTMTAVDLRGLWVPIVTPFDSTGDVDVQALARLAHRLFTDGVHGLVALGTTGEPSTLDPDERCRVVSVCSQLSREEGRPLIVGAGTNSTRGTIAEIEMLARETDMTAALVVVPYYTRPSEAAVVEHFESVADASAVPVVVYNVPYRTGCELGAESLVRLAAHANIIGLKQAVGGLDHDTLAVLGAEIPDFAVLAGDDAFICPTILMGGRGAIAAAAHLCTRLFVDMVDAALDCDVDRARRRARDLLPVVQAGFAEPNPGVWKGALHHLGELSSAELRRPLTPASHDSVRRLLDVSDAARVAA